MANIPDTPRELVTLNTRNYRTLHNLFERLSETQPDLNVAILDFIDGLDKSNQKRFLNILYQLENERIECINCNP
jgi:hypothetical protein